MREPAASARLTPDRIRRSGPWLAVCGAFVVSRAAYSAAGVRMRIVDLRSPWQLADPELLQHRLFETLWYLHTQPPLWNLLVGLVLRWSPVGTTTGLRLVYMACGLVLLLGLYDLGRQLRLGGWTAAVVAIAIGCAPGVVLYESFLNYEFLVATMLVLIADATARWARTGHAGALAALAGLAAAAALTRSLMHPVWFVAVIVFALMVRRPVTWSWKPIAAIAVPVFLVGGAMAKNEVLFGSTELSSLTGFAAHSAVARSMSAKTRARLRAQKKLVLPLFPTGGCHIKHPHVPVLAEVDKSRVNPHDPPQLNYNYECLSAYSRRLEREALTVLRENPRLAVQQYLNALELWATPTELFPPVVQNRTRIAAFDKLYRRAILLDVAWTPPVSPGGRTGPSLQVRLAAPDGRYHLSLTVVLATLITFGGGALILVQLRRRRLNPARAAYLYGSATVLYTTVVGNLFSYGESNRIRMLAEPLTFVLAIAGVARAVRVIRTRRSDRQSSRQSESEHEHALTPGL